MSNAKSSFSQCFNSRVAEGFEKEERSSIASLLSTTIALRWGLTRIQSVMKTFLDCRRRKPAALIRNRDPRWRQFERRTRNGHFNHIAHLRWLTFCTVRNKSITMPFPWFIRHICVCSTLKVGAGSITVAGEHASRYPPLLRSKRALQTL